VSVDAGFDSPGCLTVEEVVSPSVSRFTVSEVAAPGGWAGAEIAGPDGGDRAGKLENRTCRVRQTTVKRPANEGHSAICTETEGKATDQFLACLPGLRVPQKLKKMDYRRRAAARGLKSGGINDR